MLTRPQVDEFHRLGARVFPYAVDGRIDIPGMLALEVDGLILDDPLEVRKNVSSTVKAGKLVLRN